MDFRLIILMLLSVVCTAKNVNLINNGYEGVLVGISPSLDESQADDIISSIKQTITEASDILFIATRGRAYFRNVTILIPLSWTNTDYDEIALNENFEDSNIRVDTPNIVYGTQPYTLQPGSCGEPGQYIHLTPEYLTESIQEELWGPRDKALVHEWAKLRWGVFDEIGYPRDRRFPLFYWSWQFTSNGIGVLKVNTCNNQDLKGDLVDVDTRGTCKFTTEGLPDDNCRFVPEEAQTARSSLMSYYHLNSIDEFCDSGSNEIYVHNTEAPNKHNLMCNERSVWDIMLEHDDFANGTNQAINMPNIPEIKVVRQTLAKFVLILDYSGSMSSVNRMQKLQRTARRWILHEVSQGSYVGIVKFSDYASLVANLTEITNMTSREELASLIDLSAGGGTSIGAGLSIAVNEVLKGQENSVIILVTDGGENESPYIADVLPSVVSSGARVVTIAFGANADPNLESLAEQTDGKTFTVVDEDDGGMLDDAFQGSLTYQPGETLNNAKISIYEFEYTGSNKSISGNFIIDSSIGRNLQFRLDTNDESYINDAPILVQPNGSTIDSATFDNIINMWIIDVDLAEEGMWVWSINISGIGIASIRASVTAMSRDPEELPIHTKAWMEYGTSSIAGIAKPIVVYAQVQKGNNPVIGAKVRAYVTTPDALADILEIDLLDNGVGADNIANDGVYSRYLMTTMTGRFSVKAQVWDDGSSYISGGFITSKKKAMSYRHPLSSISRVKRSAPADPFGVPDYCCGSEMPFNPDTSTPTGPFNRIAPGGSFKVDIPPPGSDSIPPGRVTDLEVNILNMDQLELAWTATGADLDQGIISAYEIQLSTNRSDLTDDIFNTDNNNTILLSYDESTNITDIIVDAGNKVVFNVSLINNINNDTLYYIVLQARDEYNQLSGTSNHAFVYIATPKAPIEPEGTSTKGWTTVLIVVGSLVACCLVSASLVFAKKKKWF